MMMTSIVMKMMIITRQLEAAGLPKSSALGLFGIPGLTAYLGLMEIGKPKVGLGHDIVVIDSLLNLTVKWKSKKEQS